MRDAVKVAHALEPEARCLLRPGARRIGFLAKEGKDVEKDRLVSAGLHGDLIDEVRTVEKDLDPKRRETRCVLARCQ